MTNFTATFNSELSRLALKKIHANPELWDQTLFHCGSAHCYMGWCDIISGNWDGDKRGDVSQKTIDLIGLNDDEYDEFVDPDNSLARLEALHTFHVTSIFGIKGRDSDGFDRGWLDIDGYDRHGYNKEGYNIEGYDNEDFDRDGFDRDGYDVKGNLPYVFVDRYRFDEYGLDRQGFDVKGVKPRLIDKYKSN